ncbi:MAG: hypothetical protein EU533_00150 [Promethearchaeota archaeon]|nr:MAG: hypothetical protein EU533_00150 [Candidatus Lokiarchaeota archaeon]
MKNEIGPERMDLKNKIAVYITIDGVPLFNLPYKTDDDSYILMSSFLHTIDILAEETRKKIGRSADFYGFDLVDNIQVEVLEVTDQDVKSENRIRLFLQTPYGKEPINRSSIIALFGATRAIIPKIKKKELNLIHKTKAVNYFKEKLIEKGYTPERIMSELGQLTVSRAHFSNYIPISLFSIEKEEENEEKYKFEEIGNYNSSYYKKNPIKNELGKLTFDSGLIISLADTLKSYQLATNVKTESILLRFRDYSLMFYYKKDGLPVISVFIEGTGNIEEMKKYHQDLKKLDIVD